LKLEIAHNYPCFANSLGRTQVIRVIYSEGTMDNVINLHEKSGGDALKVDFKMALDTPLNLGLSESSETELTNKKPSLYKRRRWKFIKFSRLFFDFTIRPIRDYFYHIEGGRLAGELTALAMKLNRKDFHVFVNFYGHVERIEVTICRGGWKKEGSKLVILEGWLPGRYEYGKMKPKDIKEAMKLLKSLSRLNNLVKK